MHEWMCGCFGEGKDQTEGDSGAAREIWLGWLDSGGVGLTG